MKRQPSFVVTWLESKKYGMPRAIDFYTRKKAIAFFNDHSKDDDKLGMHVIHLTYDSIEFITK